MRKVNKAVILAAGLGSRLSYAACPEGCKPLTRVAGLPLIKRILYQLQLAEIEEALIVVGYRKDSLIKYLKLQKDLKIRIRFVLNEDFDLPNGMSLLKCKDFLKYEPFLLLMADHLFSTEILQNLLAQPIPYDGAILAVDEKFTPNIDLADATKVAIAGGRIWRIGKGITIYTAVDTGLFLCTPSIFEAMETAVEEGNASLSAGMQIIAGRRRLFPMGIGEYYWQDIDNLEDKRKAEEIVLRELQGRGGDRLTQDIPWQAGFVSRFQPSMSP